MCNRLMCNWLICNWLMCNWLMCNWLMCIKKKKDEKEKELLPITIMTINPIYSITESTDLFSRPANNKERIIPNRKSKDELNEEFYNHSKEALQGLDNYLFENSFDFGFE